MSLTKLDISLEQYEVGLSGAIPERNKWSEPAMDRGILEFIALFSGIVLKYGGRIVHGAHPAFTPIILRQARLQASNRTRKPVTIVMSDLWAQDSNSEDMDSITDIAELIITKKIGNTGQEDPKTRNASLTAMRKVLIDAQNVMVAVGGKMHSHDGMVPGVEEEMKLAEEKGLPRFLVAGLGGFARELAEKITPASLNNSLSQEENVKLFSTDDVASCVNIIFDHLAHSEELAKSSFQPIKWNNGNKVIQDHRDGTVQTETMQCIYKIAV